MLNILKGAKVAQDSDTGDIYLIDCCDGPKNLSAGGGGSGSGGCMSYDVIVTSPDGGQTYEITHGTYADLKAKIDAHEPAHMLLLMDITDGDATTKFQVPSMCVAMDASGEISGLIYMIGSPAPVSLYILPDGTAEVRV